jgi:pyrophosphatase PpaX
LCAAVQPPPAAILFDLDGTLIDSIELIVRSFQHATGEHLGAPLERAVILPTIGLSLIDELERIAPGKGQDLLLSYRGFLRAHHDALIAEYEGVAGMLDALHRREVPMGIVTSKALVSAEPSLRRFGLDRLMATIVTWDDTERHKPHPEPLLLAAARLGVPAPACWYVGDSTHDMAAARAAGMRAVAAAWGPYPRAELAPLADVVLEAPAELPALLERRAAR